MKLLKLSLLALAAFGLTACGGSSGGGDTSAPTASNPTSTSVAPSKSFTLSKSSKIVEGAKTLDLKPFIQLGDNTTLADLEFSTLGEDVTFENGVATSTKYGFYSIDIKVKDTTVGKSFSAVFGPLNFVHATYQGLTPSGRDSSLNYTYDNASTITLAINGESFTFTSTAGKGLVSGEQVDIPAANFTGTFTLSDLGLFLLTNNEAGWSGLKGNFFDRGSDGFSFDIGGFPNGGAPAKLTMITD